MLLAALSWGALAYLPVGQPVHAARLTCTPAATLAVAGPSFVTVGVPVSVTATLSPLDATGPITLTWSPPPVSAPLSRTAVYRWSQVGQHPLTVTASGCGGTLTTTWQANVATRPVVDLQIAKRGPSLALAGMPIVYTLTVTNTGGSPAQNLLITDTLPVQSAHGSGGMVVGRSVRWLVPTLPGYGEAVQVAFSVLAGITVVNHEYGADAVTTGVLGTQPVTTTIVQALTTITPGGTGTLAFGSSDVLIQVDLPAGSVNTPAKLGLLRLDRPTHPAPSRFEFGGNQFQLLGESASPLVLTGPVTLRIGYGAQPDVGALVVAAWNGSSYDLEGIGCVSDIENRQLICTWSNPTLTEVVLLAPLSPLYIPMIPGPPPPPS
jgi:uncharacterized repeat protein (TIGR01451 family)